MELNSILFPAPKATYTSSDPNIIYIPFGNDLSKTSLLTSPRGNSLKTMSTEGTQYSMIASKLKKTLPLFQKPMGSLSVNSIPCLLSIPKVSNSNLGIYFHSNGEDVMLAKELIDFLSSYLSITIIAPEYPGYGVHTGSATQELVLEQAEQVYKYFSEKNGMPESHIVVIGRSIGCAPAIHVASRFYPGALVLVSPFSSIGKMADHFCCTGTSILIREKFDNLEKTKRCKSPCLLIHGIKDKLIPWTHSKTIYENYGGPCQLIIPTDMDHTSFDYDLDLGNPVFDFLEKLDFYSGNEIEGTPKFVPFENSESSSINSL